MSEEIVRLKSPVTDQDHIAGPASAGVTLVEYGNFEAFSAAALIAALSRFEMSSQMECA